MIVEFVQVREDTQRIKMAEKTGFIAKARIIQILGEQSIRDNAVGLIELIKNGYDADAEKVNVSIAHINEPSKTQVIVEDNGFGMDEKTIRGPWCINLVLHNSYISAGRCDGCCVTKHRLNHLFLPLLVISLITFSVSDLLFL